MRILFFTKYTSKGPSSRYRVYQYLPYIEGFYKNIEVSPFFGDSYSPVQSYKNINTLFNLVKSYLNRLSRLLRIKKDDIIFVQYEFTPFLPFNVLYFKIRKIKYVVDFDDAVFHDYDQHKSKLIRFFFKKKISKVIKYASHVITGSPYLTSYARQFNDKVTEIPTSINFEKYKPKSNHSEKLIIGWIGSETTSWNVLSIIPAFHTLKEKGINFEIRCIGFNVRMNHYFKDLPFYNIPWSSETEIKEIQKFNVGIMPLGDKLFNKGKCAFKLIQYMACGIPTISSPLEANVKVDLNKENLFARDNKEWLDCFFKIYDNQKKYIEVGLNNREVIRKYYSVQINYKKYINIFNKL